MAREERHDGMTERCYPEEWFTQNAAHIRLVETERDWLRRDYEIVKRERDQALEREWALQGALAEAITQLGGSIVIEPRMDKKTWVMTGPEPVAASGLAYRYRVVWIEPAPVSHGEVECDHPCPEYMNGEDCRCTRANGGRPDGFGAALYDARLAASVPSCDELAANSGHVVSVHDTAALRATDDERGTA